MIIAGNINTFKSLSFALQAPLMKDIYYYALALGMASLKATDPQTGLKEHPNQKCGKIMGYRKLMWIDEAW